ncbi:MAG: SRPBCC family protein [Nocardioidaceae bacterium]|nr:SRPBCC family protein [Nocardioidaceae bacterium]MCL2615090.1 SRPBCC family protein [Nocardioidaceae bacterium]
MSIRTVTVRRRLGAPAADLFAVLTDPALFARVRGIRGVEVLKEGTGGPTSPGTVRRVSLAAGFLTEEVVAAEGTRFDYRIRDASVPFDHRFGRIEFHDRDGHTEAAWTSTLAFDQPVVAPLLASVAVAGSYVGFAAALHEIDRAARALTTRPPTKEH